MILIFVRVCSEKVLHTSVHFGYDPATHCLHISGYAPTSGHTHRHGITSGHIHRYGHTSPHAHRHGTTSHACFDPNAAASTSAAHRSG